MTVLTEGVHDGGFLINEANGDRSRDVGILQLLENLEAGTILGKVTATGELVQYDPAAADGSESVNSILFANVDATLVAKDVTIISRDATYNLREIIWDAALNAGQILTGEVELSALGLIGRGV